MMHNEIPIHIPAVLQHQLPEDKPRAIIVANLVQNRLRAPEYRNRINQILIEATADVMANLPPIRRVTISTPDA